MQHAALAPVPGQEVERVAVLTYGAPGATRRALDAQEHRIEGPLVRIASIGTANAARHATGVGDSRSRSRWSG